MLKGTMRIKNIDLWLIDILIIIFLVVQIQSMISNVDSSIFEFYSLKKQISDSRFYYVFSGWAETLRSNFGTVYDSAKFLLFGADIYLIMKKIRLIIKKDIGKYLIYLLFLDSLFAYLKITEFFHWVLTAFGG